MKHIARLLLVLAALALLVAACGDDGDPAADDDSAADDPGGDDDATRITVYSGRDDTLIGPLLDGFEEQTGIEVDARYADSAELALLIQTEGDRSPADVMISQSPGALGFLAGEGLLPGKPGNYPLGWHIVRNDGFCALHHAVKSRPRTALLGK